MVSPRTRTQVTITVERSNAPPLSVVMMIPRPAAQPGKGQAPFHSISMDRAPGGLMIRVDTDLLHSVRAEIPCSPAPGTAGTSLQFRELQAEALARAWLRDRCKLWSAAS